MSKKVIFLFLALSIGSTIFAGARCMYAERRLDQAARDLAIAYEWRLDIRDPITFENTVTNWRAWFNEYADCMSGTPAK